LEKLVIYQSKETDIINIENDAFENARHLVYLRVASTYCVCRGLCHFKDETFRSLVNLKRLKIRLDTKESIKKLRWLSNLEELDLYGSSFNQINTDTFVHHTQLSKLYLTWCGIREIHPDAFSHLPHLQELDLSGNELAEIDLKHVAPRILKADYNWSLSLISLNDSCMKNSALEELTLSSFRSYCIGAQIDISPALLLGTRRLSVRLMREMSFSPFVHLEKIDLRPVSVNVINKGRLASLCNLKYLRIEFNHLSK
jgi:Leucine-rich repeat (LRR) protein